jgi:hypothetical protein
VVNEKETHILRGYKVLSKVLLWFNGQNTIERTIGKLPLFIKVKLTALAKLIAEEGDVL